MIYLGLGGNVGTDADILERFANVTEIFREDGYARASSVYRTAPIGPAQQPFLNAALELRPATIPSPARLLRDLHDLERYLGRDRASEVRWGPRPIDLDVLLWVGRDGRWPCDAHWLDLPHPRLVHRRFALEPLSDLLPDHTLIAGRTLRAWLDDVTDQPVAKTPLRLK